MKKWDVAVIGGGILGVSTALRLSERFEGIGVVVLEKEPEIARHQSGRNSGVIHSGLYYRPGSLKAELCVTGAERLVEFCDANGVPYQRNGKVVVATRESDLPALDELHRRGVANGLPGVRRLRAKEISEFEPHAAGLAGLHVPSTGTVDFRQVTRSMANLLARHDCEVLTRFQVGRIVPDADSLRLVARNGEVSARALVNCAGLYADRVAELAGVKPPARIVPFRGEYYDIGGASAHLVNGSIYPVPDPRLPFLGVHLTRTVAATVHAGPNAVLALAREGYRWGTIRPRDTWDSISYPGLWRLAGRFWKAGLSETTRSASKRRFVASLRELVPDIDPGDVERGLAGVRAQALSKTGDLIDDFLLIDSPRAVHVLNAPSPAATASLAIADKLVDRISQSLG